MRARDNPFRTDQVLRIRYRLEGTSWPDLVRRCANLRLRAAIIGPHGSGKTTLLEDLGGRLSERGFSTVPISLYADQPAFARGFLENLCATLSPNTVLLFDGAEQLPYAKWLWFRGRTRRAAGLIITTHQPGRLPTLWECRTSPDLLSGIAAELLDGDELSVRAQAQELYRAHQGNLREALRDWYDLSAQAGGGAQAKSNPGL